MSKLSEWMEVLANLPETPRPDTVTITISRSAFLGLRMMRARLWDTVTFNRAQQRRQEERGRKMSAGDYKRIADSALQQIQNLNDVFAGYPTAEEDWAAYSMGKPFTKPKQAN